MDFKGKEYNIEVNKIEEPMLYGKVWFSQSMVAEILWRFKDQKGYGKKCDTPMVVWQSCAKDVGVSSDNWNIKERRNLFHWYVYNEVCELVGLQRIDLEAKEKELAQQAPKAYKKPIPTQQSQQTVQTPVQQVPQAPVQNPVVQQLLNSRVQLRGTAQQQTAAPVQKAMPKIKVWTDGSCLGNPGLGGWAAVFVIGSKCMPIWGSASDTTNNRMEVMALVEALEWLDRPCDIQIFLDSEYVRKIAVGENKAGKNSDLWDRYFKAVKRHNVSFEHVEAHQINPQSLEAKLNNMADETARDAAEKQLPKPTREEAKAKMTEISEPEPDYYPDDEDYYEEG